MPKAWYNRLVDMLTSRSGALLRNSNWNQHVRYFQPRRALPPDEPRKRPKWCSPEPPALSAARPGFEIVRGVGVPAIRERSLRLTRRLIEAAKTREWRLNTPTDDHERGGAVVIDVPNGQAVADALIARGIIVDHRPQAGIRVAPHFYNTEQEVDAAIAAIDAVIDESRGLR